MGGERVRIEKEKRRSEREDKAEIAEAVVEQEIKTQAAVKKGRELKSSMDKLLDEINGVLDEVEEAGFTAEKFLQKGGQVFIVSLDLSVILYMMKAYGYYGAMETCQRLSGILGI